MTTLADTVPYRPSPPAAPSRVRRTVRFALPPLAAYLLGHLVYLTGAIRSGVDYFTVAAHARWDSTFYEEIAGHGYHMFVCDTEPKFAFYGNAWCGNAGWFPLYPWLIRLVRMVTGLSVARSALLVGEAATIAAVLLFWWLLTRLVPSEPGTAGRGMRPRGAGLRNAALLALVVVFPVGIYFHAVFPMSVAVAATLACLALATRRHWVLAGLAGAAAAAAYPVGVATGLGAVAAVAALAGGERNAVPRYLIRAALVGALSLGGLVLVFVVMRVATGHWDAFFLSQDKYGGQRHDPLYAFIAMVSHGPAGPDTVKASRMLTDRLDVAVRAEMWASLGLVLLACACAVVAAVRRRIVALDVGLAFFAVVAWLVPLFAGTQISQYRSHALLLPVLLLLRHLPGWLLGLLTIPAALLAYKMGTLFYVSLLF